MAQPNNGSPEIVVVSSNLQGYYDYETWTRIDYGGFLGTVLGKLPHSRRVPDCRWLAQAATSKILNGTSLLLAQEITPALCYGISTQWGLLSPRAQGLLPQYHRQQKPYTTDILFDPEVFELQNAWQFGPYEQSKWPDCHVGVALKLKHKLSRLVLTALSAHCEAGVGIDAEKRRVEQLQDILGQPAVQEAERLVIGIDTNDYGKRTCITPLTYSELLLQELLGGREHVQHRKTYFLHRNELPGLDLLRLLRGISLSPDKLATKGGIEVVEDIEIIDGGKRYSDHKAIRAKLRLGGLKID